MGLSKITGIADLGTAMNINTAQGAALDRIGALFGISRAFTVAGVETDAEYRETLWSAATKLFRALSVEYPTRAVACECGSEKARSAGHSTWCPRYVP